MDSPFYKSFLGSFITSSIISFVSGKFKKQRSYEHNSLFEAVMLSIENLNDYHKKLYKQLAVFLDDVGIPPKVSNTLMAVVNFHSESCGIE